VVALPSVYTRQNSNTSEQSETGEELQQLTSCFKFSGVTTCSAFDPCPKWKLVSLINSHISRNMGVPDQGETEIVPSETW